MPTRSPVVGRRRCRGDRTSRTSVTSSPVNSKVQRARTWAQIGYGLTDRGQRKGTAHCGHVCPICVLRFLRDDFFRLPTDCLRPIPRTRLERDHSATGRGCQDELTVTPMAAAQASGNGPRLGSPAGRAKARPAPDEHAPTVTRPMYVDEGSTNNLEPIRSSPGISWIMILGQVDFGDL